MTTPGTALSDSAATADAAMGRLQDALRRIGDGDLHRAHRGGGWTVAQVISHMNVATLMWLGDLERLRNDPDAHVLLPRGDRPRRAGLPAAHDRHRPYGRIASTRRTLATCLPAVDPAILDRTVEIPDLGTMTVAEWTPIIVGHLAGHVDQAFDDHARPRVPARGGLRCAPPS